MLEEKSLIFEIKEDQIKKSVRETYGRLAREHTAGIDSGIVASCCGAPAAPDVEYSKTLGYSIEEAACVPDGANLGLGCGNPQAIAQLRAGEVVLDLGSGAGFDCFLAAKQVGETGHVIGVDMTGDMVEKARANALKGNYSNVEFRLGEIENLPVESNSIDAIISNCVVNLSTNKPLVYKEAARVLKEGGRIAISDVVATAPIPQHIKDDVSLYNGCMAGAIPITELESILKEAGFEGIRIVVKEASRAFIQKWDPSSSAEHYVAAATIEAFKPRLVLHSDPAATSSSVSGAVADSGPFRPLLFSGGHQISSSVSASAVGVLEDDAKCSTVSTCCRR